MRRYTLPVLAVAALVAAVALTACSQPAAPSGGGTSGGTPSASAQIVLKNIAVSPQQVTIAVGGTVTFVNQDSTDHRMVDDGGAYDSGMLAPGADFKQTFAKAGTFPFHCSIHPTMTGTIIVK
jgi:plastocyanin